MRLESNAARINDDTYMPLIYFQQFYDILKIFRLRVSPLIVSNLKEILHGIIN